MNGGPGIADRICEAKTLLGLDLVKAKMVLPALMKNRS